MVWKCSHATSLLVRQHTRTLHQTHNRSEHLKRTTLTYHHPLDGQHLNTLNLHYSTLTTPNHSTCHTHLSTPDVAKLASNYLRLIIHANTCTCSSPPKLSHIPTPKQSVQPEFKCSKIAMYFHVQNFFCKR